MCEWNHNAQTYSKSYTILSTYKIVLKTISRIIIFSMQIPENNCLGYIRNFMV